MGPKASIKVHIENRQKTTYMTSSDQCQPTELLQSTWISF